MSVFGDLRNGGIDMQPGGAGIVVDAPIQFYAGAATRVGRGKIFYVDSVNGSANYDGKTPTRALATIDQAINKCTANQGDVVYVLPGHVETISGATGLVMDVAGVSVIGLGSGGDRPTLTLSASASTVSITAASCVLANIKLISSFTGGVAAGITLGATADGTKLLNIEMQETANTKEWLIGISVAAACHEVEIDGLRYFGIAGGSTTQVIKFVGASNYSIVRNFLIYADASGALIDALTAASLFMTIGNGVGHNLDTGAGLTVSVKSDTTGFMHDLRLTGLNATGVPAGAAMSASQVYVSNVIFTQGFLQPVADS